MEKLNGNQHLPFSDKIGLFAKEELEKLLLIRNFENALLDLFTEGKLKGTTHTCIGQEYIPVSLSPLIREDDFILSNHRGHGHYLARFGDAEGLLAEIMGKEGAVCNGVGGSQHIYREEGYLSTGIQGESVPVAAGIALHNKESKNGGISMAYIGDGTWGEGSVYEALNMAGLWRLPMVVIVENNRIAQTTPLQSNMSGNIHDRAKAFNINYLKISSLDIYEIRECLKPLFDDVRTGCNPLIVEFETYRIGPHSKGDDTRQIAEIKLAQERDWYKIQKELGNEHLSALDEKVKSEIDSLVTVLKAREEASWQAIDAQ